MTKETKPAAPWLLSRDATSPDALARVDVRPEVVPRDSTATGALNVEHSLGRNAVVYPLRDRLRRDTNGARQSGLRPKFLERGGEDFSAHENRLIHWPFMRINGQIIADPQTVSDHKAMVDKKSLPLPENYASFSAWVRAMAVYTGSQANLARGVGVSPQMITKYLRGGAPESENLQKFADFAAISYAKLRLLVDGKPLSDAKNIKDRINQTATPMGAQVGRKWEAIQDEKTRGFIEQQIEHALEQERRLEAAGKKRAG